MGSWRAHQRMLNNLESRLLDDEFYEHVYREIIYKNLKGKSGEIDLVGTHGNTAILFEIKSGDKDKSYNYAINVQLPRGAKYLLRQEMYDRAVMFSFTPRGLLYEGTKYRKV